MCCFKRSCCVFRWVLQFENWGMVPLTVGCFFVALCEMWIFVFLSLLSHHKSGSSFYEENDFCCPLRYLNHRLPFPAQPPHIRLFIDCVILISMGWTPPCRCYSSPPPPVNSGFNLTSFDLFTYVMCNVSGSLPSLCFPPRIHLTHSCCFIVLLTSCFCSLG